MQDTLEVKVRKSAPLFKMSLTRGTVQNGHLHARLCGILAPNSEYTVQVTLPVMSLHLLLITQICEHRRLQ